MRKNFRALLIFSFFLLAFLNPAVCLFSRLPHKWEYLAIGLIYGIFAFFVLKKWQKISRSAKWVLAFIGTHSLISVLLSFVLFQRFTSAYLPIPLKEFLKNINFILHLPSKIYLVRAFSSVSSADIINIAKAYHPFIKSLLDLAYGGLLGVIAYQIYKRLPKKPISASA